MNSVHFFLVGALYTLTIKYTEQQDGNEYKFRNYYINGVTIAKISTRTHIYNRFATTVVTERLENSEERPTEGFFFVIFPDNAFVKSFSILRKGKPTVARFENETTARIKYASALSGRMPRPQDIIDVQYSNAFRVKIYMDPKEIVTCALTYQEILPRKNGVFENVLSFFPGLPVYEGIDVEVHIHENKKIKDLKVNPLTNGRGGQNTADPKAAVKQINDTHAVVKFSADYYAQRKFEKKMKIEMHRGLSGQLSVQYDVERDSSGAELLTRNCYFVNYFAKPQLQAISKYIVFLLDISHSMGDHKKIDKLKKAMNHILDQIRSIDVFHLVAFNSDIKVFNLEDSKKTLKVKGNVKNIASKKFQLPNAFPGTAKYIKAAKKLVQGLKPTRGTVFKTSLEMALELIETENKNSKVKRLPLITFITDGSLTAEKSDTVIKKITKLNHGSRFKNASIMSISLGKEADRRFTRKLSRLNKGISEHIYDANNTVQKLEKFFDGVCSPTLKNIKFSFDPSDVVKVTETQFPLYLEGSEIVAAGKCGPSKAIKSVKIVSEGSTGMVELKANAAKAMAETSRVWAILTLQKLMAVRKDLQSGTTNKTSKSLVDIEKKILKISEKFSFITDLNSMVIPINKTYEVIVGMTELKDLLVKRNSNPGILFESNVQGGNKDNNYALPQTDISKDGITIPTMNIKSEIHNRFSSTVVTISFVNMKSILKRKTVSIPLPDKALVTKFVLVKNGKTYTSYVNSDKEVRGKLQTVLGGASNKPVGVTNVQKSNAFTVSIDLQPKATVTLHLTYDIQLHQKSGIYENIIDIYPGQLTKNLSVEVSIKESRKIKDVKVDSLTSGRIGNNVQSKLDLKPVIKKKKNSAVVTFTADSAKQKEFATSMKTTASDGLAAQFLLRYELEPTPKGGELITKDDYFVFYFIPTQFKPLPKYVVFLLDISGGVASTKLNQLKRGLEKILDQLQDKDMFHIVTISGKTQIVDLNNPKNSVVVEENHRTKNFKGVKLPPANVASKVTIDQAKKAIKSFKPETHTDCLVGLQLGLQLVEVLKKSKGDTTNRQSIISFVSDSNYDQATSTKIIETITKLNVGLKKSSIISIYFGTESSKGFTERLSLANMGHSKHIYEGKEFPLQIYEFFQEVAVPVLTNVSFSFSPPDAKAEVSKTTFEMVSSKGEIEIVGHLKGSKKITSAEIKAVGTTGPVKIDFKSTATTSNCSRIWAYHTLEELMKTKKIMEITKSTTRSTTMLTIITSKIIEISTSYSYVTNLTSMVIVNEGSKVIVGAKELEEANKPSTPLSNTPKPTTKKPSKPPTGTLTTKKPRISTTKKGVTTTTKSSSTPVKPGNSKTPKLILPTYSDELVKDGIAIPQMQVHSNIENRLSTTTVTQTIANTANKPKKKHITIPLPKDALVSKIVLSINGKNYTSYVNSDKEVRGKFPSVLEGASSKQIPTMNVQNAYAFTVFVDLKPKATVILYVTYEELLHGKGKSYVNIINIYPGQLTKNLSVEVSIAESRNIKDVKIDSIKSGQPGNSVQSHFDLKPVIKKDKNLTMVVFTVDLAKQKELASSMKTVTNNGLAAQFELRYEMEPTPKGGELITKDNYFVFYFTPSQFKPLPKYVVFVLDISGSMKTTKLDQLKIGLEKIFDQLQEKDMFHIITVSSKTQIVDIKNPKNSITVEESHRIKNFKGVKLPPANVASKATIDLAKKAIKTFKPETHTDCLVGLQLALQLVEVLKKTKGDSTNRQPIISFFSDSNIDQATSNKIIKTITKLNVGTKKSVIISIHVGTGSSKGFSELLSLANMGHSKHIYKGTNFASQIYEFFLEAAVPVLTNVSFSFSPPDAKAEVSKTTFDMMSSKGEYKIVGKVQTSTPVKLAVIDAVSTTGPVKLEFISKPSTKNCSRIWAIKTLKDLMKMRKILLIIKTTPSISMTLDTIIAKIIQISTSFSVFSDLTSMVIVNEGGSALFGAKEREKIISSSTSNQVPPSSDRRGSCTNNEKSSTTKKPLTTESNSYKSNSSISSEPLKLTASKPGSSTTKRPSTKLTTPRKNFNNDSFQSYPSELVKDGISISEMKISSKISSRFATTVVTQTMTNTAKSDKLKTIVVPLPMESLVTSFIMFINGKNYTSYIKDDQEARDKFKSALALESGKKIEAPNVRNSKTFGIAVNLKSKATVTFFLTYDEMVKERNGSFRHVLNIYPGQLTGNLHVEVTIKEDKKIKNVKVSPLESGKNVQFDRIPLKSKVKVTKTSDTSTTIIFSANSELQKKLIKRTKTSKTDGFAAQFSVQYNIEPAEKGALLIANDGYFVNYFDPVGLEPLPKYIIFVLDISGSMAGVKIKQLKTAMINILDQLLDDDLFNIVIFNEEAKILSFQKSQKSITVTERHRRNGFKKVNLMPGIPAKTKFIKAAKQAVQKLYGFGGTNCILPLEVGLQLVKETKRKKKVGEKERLPFIVFLTDGEFSKPLSVSETLTRISKLNAKLKVPIQSLSFGKYADKSFTKKLALENYGRSRHIYEAKDSAQQLKNFFGDISSPTLANLTFTYKPSDIAEVTQSRFPIHYLGQEIIVAGKAGPSKAIKSVEIRATGPKGPVKIKANAVSTTSDCSRIWAYLSTKVLTKKKNLLSSSNKTHSQSLASIDKKLKKISNKYSYITSTNSMVIVSEEKSVVVGAKELMGILGSRKKIPTTKKPKRTTTKPKRTTEKPKRTTKKPRRTTNKPKRTTKKSIRTTTKPIRATKKPKITTKKSIKTTTKPIRTTKKPKSTTNKPRRTTKKSIRTTKKDKTNTKTKKIKVKGAPRILYNNNRDSMERKDFSTRDEKFFSPLYKFLKTMAVKLKSCD